MEGRAGGGEKRKERREERRRKGWGREEKGLAVQRDRVDYHVFWAVMYSGQ